MNNKNTSIYLAIILSATSTLYCNFTVLIIPAGNAHYAGRSIGDRFERGLTLQLAHAIENKIALTEKKCSVVIYKSSDQLRPSTTEIAQFANRLNPDLVIALSLYLETDPKPHWYIYHYSAGDHLVQLTQALQLVALDQAHLVRNITTRQYTEALEKQLLKTNFFTPHIGALPINVLAGITAPALLCEIGIKKEDDWQTIVDPLTTYITQAQIDG